MNKRPEERILFYAHGANNVGPRDIAALRIAIVGGEPRRTIK